MTRTALLAVALLFLNAPARAERSTGSLPAAVTRFHGALVGSNPNAAAFLVPLPTVIYETAYDYSNGSCTARYHKVTVKSADDLKPYLNSLRHGWAKFEIAQEKKSLYYGVSRKLQCVHLWAVKVNAPKNKIVAVVVDSPDNAWDSTRREFSMTTLP